MRGDTTVEDLEALRVPITAYCYRMLASAADAEDAAQDGLIRAAARMDQFDPSRGRLSTWLHRIATNICIDMLRAASRRALVVDMTPIDGQSAGGLGPPLPPQAWVEPMPDSILLSDRPEERLVARETVRLAFVAALQWLTPRQRAVLVLRDVLAFSAREASEILGTTEASVNSALQRARAAMAEQRRESRPVVDLGEADQHALLERYVAAFEAHDVAELTRLLREDAVASMPPFAWSVRGGARIADLLGSGDACAGARLVPCRFNGGLGLGQYRPADDGRLLPFALVALDLDGGQISQVVTFLGTDGRFAEFGLPAFIRT